MKLSGKALGIIGAVISIGAAVVGGALSEKQTDMKIADAVSKALAEKKN